MYPHTINITTQNGDYLEKKMKKKTTKQITFSIWTND